MDTVYPNAGRSDRGSNGTNVHDKEQESYGQFGHKDVKKTEGKEYVLCSLHEPPPALTLPDRTVSESDDDSGISSGASSEQTTPEPVSQCNKGFVNLDQKERFRLTVDSSDFKCSEYGQTVRYLERWMSKDGDVEELEADTSKKIRETMASLYQVACSSSSANGKEVCLRCVELIATIQRHYGLGDTQNKAVQRVVNNLFSVHHPETFNVIKNLAEIIEAPEVLSANQSIAQLLSVKNILACNIAAPPSQEGEEESRIQQHMLMDRCVESIGKTLQNMELDIKSYSPSYGAIYEACNIALDTALDEEYKRNNKHPYAESGHAITLKKLPLFRKGVREIPIKIEVKNGHSFDNYCCFDSTKTKVERKQALDDFVGKLERMMTPLSRHQIGEIAGCFSKAVPYTLHHMINLVLCDVWGPLGQFDKNYEGASKKIVCYFDPETKKAQVEIKLVMPHPVLTLKYSSEGGQKGQLQFKGNSRFVISSKVKLLPLGLKRVVFTPKIDICLERPEPKG